MAKTVELINDNYYNVYILPEAREKMEMYCELCEKEIGWLGFVEKVAGLNYIITDVVLLKQEVHAATTEIDPNALLDFWSSTPIEQQSKIKIWGHSHVNMAPNPSGQDDDQMDYFKDGNEWFIRLITNKDGDMNITIYDYVNGIEVHTDKLITYNPNREELRKQIQEEIKDKVSEKKYTITKEKSHYYNYTIPKYECSNKITEPMFDDIQIKYVNNFDDVLNDIDYWQNVL